MKTPLIVLTVSAIGIAWFAGYWPGRKDRLAAQTSLEATTVTLERVEARNRLYSLQSKLVDLSATVEARNFGDAQNKATAFFDAVRSEAVRSDQSQAKGALENILATRDSLTGALSQADPAVRDLVHGIMTQLRESLGEPALQAPAPAHLPTAMPSPV